MKKSLFGKNEDKGDIKEKNYLRNYLLLGIIFIGCFALTLYFCKMYNVYDEYQKEIPVIRDTLVEITYVDLNHYVVDNPSVVIYMCLPNDDTCRSFERDLKKYVHKHEIADEFLYLNLSGIDLDTFVDQFNKKYHFKTKLTSHFPAFVSFEDGKVTAILQDKQNKHLSISKLHSFLELIWDEDETNADDAVPSNAES